MKQLAKYFLIFSVACCCGMRTCRADLFITLRELPANRVEISWSGSGLITGASTIGTANNLDFVDFLGLIPYGPGITPDGSGDGHVFALGGPLTLTIKPGEPGEFSQDYDEIQLDNEIPAEGIQSADFSLIGTAPPLPVGESYQASGSAEVELEQIESGENLKFSDLNPGTYFTNSSFDASVFGGVTLQVVAIPEPSALFCVGLSFGLALRTSRGVVTFEVRRS